MKNSPVKLKCSREYHKKVKLTIQTLPQIASAKGNLVVVGGRGARRRARPKPHFRFTNKPYKIGSFKTVEPKRSIFQTSNKQKQAQNRHINTTKRGKR